MPTSEPIVAAQAGPGRRAYFPDIVRLDGGGLLLGYREAEGHLGPDGRILLAASEDDGRRWSEPWVAVDGPHDDRDPKLARLSDGTVLLSYFVTDWTTPGRHALLGVHVRRSEDGGRTWSEPARVGTSFARAASHGGVVELPDGDLLVPVYGNGPTDPWHRATVVRSTDGGRTWPAESEAVVASAEGVRFQEPTVTPLPGGELVALLRLGPGYAHLARSFDGGRTWTRPVATDLPASSHHALALTTGEVLLTYGDFSDRYSPRRETVGRLIRRPAESWDGYGDLQLYDSGHDDQANPSSVELAPDRFLTVSFDVSRGTVVAFESHAADYPGLGAATAPVLG